MNPLVYVTCSLSLGAIAVLIHGLLSAPDGFEDDEGFHAIRPSGVAEEPMAPEDGARETGFFSAP
jgi:hypothetical protein